MLKSSGFNYIGNPTKLKLTSSYFVWALYSWNCLISFKAFSKLNWHIFFVNFPVFKSARPRISSTWKFRRFDAVTCTILFYLNSSSMIKNLLEIEVSSMNLISENKLLSSWILKSCILHWLTIEFKGFLISCDIVDVIRLANSSCALMSSYNTFAEISINYKVNRSQFYSIW